MSIVFKYGLRIGLGVCAWVLAEFLLGLHTVRAEIGQVTGFFSLIIPVLGLYFGIKAQRDQRNGGKISYAQAVKSGALISLLAAAILAGFMAVYFLFINPGAAEYIAEMTRKPLAAKGANADAIAAEVEKVKAQYTPAAQALMVFLSSLLGGLVISLIAGVWLKKRAETH